MRMRAHFRGQWHCGCFPDAAFEGSNAFQNLAGDHCVASVNDVSKTYLYFVNTSRRCKLVHLAFVREACLHNAETTHGAARRIVGANGVPINNGVRALVWPLCMRNSINENC